MIIFFLSNKNFFILFYRFSSIQSAFLSHKPTAVTFTSLNFLIKITVFDF